MVLGAAGDGKSSFVRSIMGEAFIESHNLTNACDTDTCEVDVANCDLSFKRIKVQFRQVLEACITKGISLQIKSSNKTEVKGNSLQEEKVPDFEAKCRLARIHQEKYTNMDEEISEPRCLIRVWDYGGQKVFYQLHQIFLRRNCVCALVINLATPLHHTVSDDQMPYPSRENNPMRYWQVIVYWLNGILSRMKITEGGHISDNLILVGTHKDLLHDDPEQQQRKAGIYFNELKELLKKEGKLYMKLISSFWAVDNKGGDPITFSKVRNAIIESIQKHCKWEEKRPIRWLNLEQKLHDLSQDMSLSYTDQHLVTYDKVVDYAKAFHINTHEDVQAFLEFHNLTADLTYCKGDILGQYVIPEPQWLIDVFRSLITIDKYYPQELKYEEELDELKEEGRLRTDGILLKEIWKDFIGVDTSGKIQSFLLELMTEFDLAIRYEDNSYLIPSLLPVCPISELSTGCTSPLLYRFHCTRQSYEQWKTRGKTTDHFLPNGLFQKLISQCSKLQGWNIHEKKYQDYMEFHVDDVLVALQAKTTWIQLWVCGPEPGEYGGRIAVYQYAVSECLDKLIEKYYPSLWYDFCLNPCKDAGHECVVSSRRSSLGGSENIIKCPVHGGILQAKAIRKWFGKLSSLLIKVLCLAIYTHKKK